MHRLRRTVARATSRRLLVGLLALSGLLSALPAAPAGAATGASTGAGVLQGNFAYGTHHRRSGWWGGDDCTADNAQNVTVTSPNQQTAPAQGAWDMHAAFAGFAAGTRTDISQTPMATLTGVLHLCGWYEPSPEGIPSVVGCAYAGNPRGFGGQGWFDPDTGDVGLRLYDVGWELTHDATVMSGYYQVYVGGVAQDRWGQVTMVNPWPPSFGRCRGGGTWPWTVEFLELPEQP